MDTPVVMVNDGELLEVETVTDEVDTLKLALDDSTAVTTLEELFVEVGTVLVETVKAVRVAELEFEAVVLTDDEVVGVLIYCSADFRSSRVMP